MFEAGEFSSSTGAVEFPSCFVHTTRNGEYALEGLINGLNRINDTQGGQMEGTALQMLFHIGNFRAQ